MSYFTIPLPTTNNFSEDNRSELRQLSERFAPPKVDFLSADALDNGSPQTSTRFRNPHKTVQDVKTEELQYFREFSFMTPGDLVFYLSPIFCAHEKDPSLEATDFYIYSLERRLTDILKLLSGEEKALITHVLTCLYEQDWQAAITTNDTSNDSILHVEIQLNIDFRSCPNILQLINKHGRSELAF